MGKRPDNATVNGRDRDGPALEAKVRATPIANRTRKVIAAVAAGLKLVPRRPAIRQPASKLLDAAVWERADCYW